MKRLTSLPVAIALIIAAALPADALPKKPNPTGYYPGQGPGYGALYVTPNIPMDKRVADCKRRGGNPCLCEAKRVTASRNGQAALCNR